LRRDRLAGLLWGDRGEVQARDSLRQSLAAIRQAFRRVALNPVNSERETVSFDPTGISIDAIAFERLASQTGAGPEAASLYQGALLDGIDGLTSEFEAWVRPERERIAAIAVRLLEKIAELAGAKEVATRLARQLVARDPLCEPAYRALMRLHVENGERAAALKLYATCRDVLKKELDASPDAQTEALYQDLLVARPGAKPPAREIIPSVDRPSLAVLPFTNMSTDPEQDYFSDGITEDIITELARFRSLSVISRNSSFAFKGKAVNVQDAAKELGAGYVVEGSVRKAGTRIRITAQLVYAVSGKHVWVERYDRPADDVFAIQDEVVRTVAATLAGRVEAAGAEGLRRRPTASLSAYECVLRGNALPVGDSVHEAAAHQLFEQAIALDPEYARAHAQLAMSYTSRWLDRMNGSCEELDRAFDLATRAILLDAQEVVCHMALSYIQLCRRCFEEAEFHARKAVELNPSRPNGLVVMADVFTFTGRADDAVALIADAMRLDPHHPAWYWLDMGLAHFAARRYAEAVAAIRHRPTLQYTEHAYLAACYAQLGNYEAMRAAADEVRRLRPNFSAVALSARDYFKLATDREHLASSLRKAGLPE
jgi:TolB-like protein/Flp pilus assembly protein TadD